MTYVKFKVDPKTEVKILPDLIDWASMWVVSGDVWKKLAWKTKSQIKVPIYNMHKHNKKKLVSDRDFVEKYWNSVEKYFVKIFEGITKKKIKKDKIVYFSPLISGAIADVITRKNAWIGKKFNNIQIQYIILHEMIHLYYADYLHEKNLIKQALISPLVEGIDHILLFKTDLRKLLPKSVTYNKQNFNIRNAKFMNELSKAWKNKKSFYSFIKEAIKIEKKHKNVVIC